MNIEPDNDPLDQLDPEESPAQQPVAGEEAATPGAAGPASPPDLKTRWERRIWRWFDKEQQLLNAYRQINGTDFVMSEMLMSLKELRDGMTKAKEFADKAAEQGNSRDKLDHLAMLAKMQKQHLDTLKALAKYQETTYHQRVKEGRKNKSAAPGQQVGISSHHTEVK